MKSQKNKRYIFIIFLILNLSAYSQTFRASLSSSKEKSDTEWSDWHYSGALFQINKDSTLIFSANNIRIKYKIIAMENQYTYNGNRAKVLSFDCKNSNNEFVNFKLIDHISNFFSDRKNKKFKLDRFRIHLFINGKIIRYNVYPLMLGN